MNLYLASDIPVLASVHNGSGGLHAVIISGITVYSDGTYYRVIDSQFNTQKYIKSSILNQFFSEIIFVLGFK